MLLIHLIILTLCVNVRNPDTLVLRLPILIQKVSYPLLLLKFFPTLIGDHRLGSFPDFSAHDQMCYKSVAQIFL